MLLGKSTGSTATLSASSALRAIGCALGEVKDAAHCTDTALADALFKSVDRIADYRLERSEMGAVTFLRGVAAWGEAFGNGPLALTGYALVPVGDAVTTCDLGKVAPLANALAAVATAAADGDICQRELLENAEVIERGYAIFDELRSRLDAARVARRAA